MNHEKEHPDTAWSDPVHCRRRFIHHVNNRDDSHSTFRHHGICDTGHGTDRHILRHLQREEPGIPHPRQGALPGNKQGKRHHHLDGRFHDEVPHIPCVHDPDTVVAGAHRHGLLLECTERQSVPGRGALDADTVNGHPHLRLLHSVRGCGPRKGPDAHPEGKDAAEGACMDSGRRHEHDGHRGGCGEGHCEGRDGKSSKDFSS